MIERAIIIALIAVGLLAVIPALGANVSETFSETAAGMTTDPIIAIDNEDTATD